MDPFESKKSHDLFNIGSRKISSKNYVRKILNFQVGHAFLLGDTYSKRQKAHWLKDGNPVPMHMGCYGIGVTRLIGAAIEKLSTDTHLRWPFPLAPFYICIIPPEKRSKAFHLASHYLEEVHNRLNSINGLNGSILVDDRTRVPIGERYRDARRFDLFSRLFINNLLFCC